MNPGNLEGLIPLIGGIMGTLMAYGIIPVSKDPVKGELWLRKVGPMLKILCPLVAVFGLALLFGVFNGPSRPR